MDKIRWKVPSTTVKELESNLIKSENYINRVEEVKLLFFKLIRPTRVPLLFFKLIRPTRVPLRLRS